MPLNLSSLASGEQIAAIYIGYFDRAGEPNGSTYWEDILEADNNFDLAAIASDFGTQDETREAHQFFENPTADEASAFLGELYLNLFNREIDQAGLEFWSPILTGVINGETFDSTGDGNADLTEVGDIILAIIQGAQDVDGGVQDETTIRNKIDVATEWTNAAKAAALEEVAFADLDQETQDSAKSITEAVTADETTVDAAKATLKTVFAAEFTLTESANTVAEGETITYTVTANGAVTEDTTFTVSVAGSDLGGAATSAAATDYDLSATSVTFAEGAADGSTQTFTVTANTDSIAEGLEGI